MLPARSLTRRLSGLLPRLRSVVVVSISIIVLQLALAVASMATLSAVRAYVVGESYYSKGQKDALFYAYRYAETQEEKEFQNFVAALDIPLGDAIARRALQQEPVDRQRAREGFLQAGNSPEDVDSLIWLFVWFHRVPFMANAIQIWEQADAGIEKLETLVQSTHRNVLAGEKTSVSVHTLKAALPVLNEELSRLEKDFLVCLSQASRDTQRLLLGANLLIALILMVSGGSYVRYSLNEKRRGELQLAELIGAVRDILVAVDASGQIVMFNHAAEAAFGVSAAKAVGMPLDAFLRPSGSGAIGEWDTVDSTEIHELTGRRADGSELLLEATVSPLHARQGPVRTFVCRDVTALRAEQEREHTRLAQSNLELEKKAVTDPLTGLPNRGALEQYLEDVLQSARRANGCFTLWFLDLDGFKHVNDTLGHLAGDEVLMHVSSRLTSLIRQHDKVFRVSGDEFVIVAHDTLIGPDGTSFAHRILSAVRAPLDVAGRQLGITVSVGGASFPVDGGDARSLMLAADAAMYRAKQGGKNDFRLGTDSPAITKETPQFVAEFELALARNELLLHYQPIVCAQGGSFMGAEALVRWNHPKRGLLPPGAFIGIVEAHGLAVKLGDWVLENAIRQMSAPENRELALITVNLSAVQLADRALPDRIAMLLERHGVPGHRLGVEITESMAMIDLSASQAVLEELQRMDVAICMDDFGTGHSSLSQLHRMPVSKLKIDRSFVERLPDEDNAMRIVEGIIAISRALRLEVVAEGVETQAQAELLKRLGVDAVQGYGISRPIPWSCLAGFIAQWKAQSVSGGCLGIAVPPRLVALQS